jgi:3-oxoacyl-[acyl-carrier protein] reductase
MPQEKEFAGLTALVTGSSNGIGAEAAVKFAEKGAHVLIHYRSSIDDANAVLARVRAAGSDGEIFHGDFKDSEGVHTFLKAIGGRPIDILVNNAGWLVQRTPFLEFTEELWNSVVMLNFTSVFLITQHILPGMIAKGNGVIVNISSVAARNGGGIGASAYASSKAGLSALTKGLAKEFAPKGIRVNAVSPGTIETNFHKKFSTEQMLNNVRLATPAGRLGDSEETADVILFLCSREARYIHGQIIEVNGGFLMV